MIIFGTGLILLFLGVFSGNQCHHWIRRQILHETVFLSQISQISTMVGLFPEPLLKYMFENSTCFQIIIIRLCTVKIISLHQWDSDLTAES